MSNPHDYTVAWICALSTERVAAEAFLDEEHELPVSISPHDNNNYKLGKIGRHMVVIAVLPDGEYGKSSAACVATSLLHTFPNVRVGLMVGIGGGAPSRKNDIRLGDIVVGATRGGKGGVLHYDFGKAIQNEPLQLTSFMNQAPTSLRAAISGLRAHYEGNGHNIKEAIENTLAKKPRLARKYKSPGHENDRLYQSHVIRQTDQDEACPGSCDDEETVLIPRPQRTNDEDDPMIHYGVIASGDQLMKDATIRDRFSRDHDVLCFEMEAAGLVNHFPCLIIRGICDYSDTHKSNQWQGYAAMVAAAYAKDLLLQIIPSRIEREAKIADVLSELEGSVKNVFEELKPVSRIIHSKHDRDILEWLTSHDYAISHKDIFTKAEPGTGQWFIHSQTFEIWLHHEKQNLLCFGNPGAGKTVITSIVVNHLLSEFREASDVGIAYIYCNYQRHTQQRATDILSSLLRQLVQTRSPLPRSIQDLYRSHERFRTHLTLEEISNAFSSVAREYSKIYVIIDALDECNTSDNTGATVLREILRLQQHMTVNILATSRPNKEVSHFFTGSLTLHITANDGDIRKYLDKQMGSKKFPVIDDALKAEIKNKIVSSADGMFLLASLQTSTLLSQPTKGDLLETLEAINKGERGLDEHYHQAMARIQDQESRRKALALKILTWVVHAKRPLSLRELQHALAVRKGARELDQNFIPPPEIILSLCAGLVVLDEESTLVRLVHYTTQEYFEREQERWLEDPETEITISCVTYLLFHHFGKADPKVYNGFETDGLVEDYLENYPFYNYTVHHWGHHAQSAKAQVNELVLCFLRSDAHTALCSYVMMPLFERWATKPSLMVSGLHLAARFGLWSIVLCLIDTGFQPDQMDRSYRTPLSYAAESGQEATVRLLLARDDVDPYSQSATTDSGRNITPLMFAAKNGHKGIVKLIVQRSGIGINECDFRGNTALCYAVKSRDTSIVALLLEKGANLETEDISGLTVLSVAAENGDSNMVSFLIQNGANPNYKPEKDDASRPIDLAAKCGNEEIVKLLLGIEGVVIDARDNYGMSPVIHAASRGHRDVVRLLLDRGADPELRDLRGRCPLHYAAKGGHAGVVELLLQRDVDPDPVSENGSTPFSYAAGNGHLVVAKLLWATGKINPDSESTSRSWGCRTPLSYAAEAGQEAIVEFLLDTCGVDPDSHGTVRRGVGTTPRMSEVGMTPLMFAGWRGRVAVAKILLGTNRVNPDARSLHSRSRGRTPLSFAVLGHSEAMVKLLLDTGKVNINSVSESGMTPLDHVGYNYDADL